MNEFITEDMKLAVKRGAVWMDENYPEWVAAIDLVLFKMNKCDQCVIGQAVGAYYTTIEAGAIADGMCPSEAYYWAEQHGFDTRLRYDVEEVVLREPMAAEENEYRKLELLWTDEVKKRLG